MRLSRHPRLRLGVWLTAGIMILATVSAATHQSTPPPTEEPKVTAVAKSSSAARTTKTKVRLTASTTRLTAGSPLTLTASGTKIKRKITLQRWDATKRRWVSVSTKTSAKSGRASFRITVAAHTTSYRAVAAKKSTKKKKYRAAKSAKLRVTGVVQPFTSTESAVVSAVVSARKSYSASGVGAKTGASPASCLRVYARAHSVWLASVRTPALPGSSTHTAAKRPMPQNYCHGWTITSAVSAIGRSTSPASVAKLAVSGFLTSPYGDSDAVLSTCYSAPAWQLGVGAVTKSGTTWVTVLVGSRTTSTTKSGVC